MNRIQKEPHISIENTLVYWLKCLTAKQAVWVQFLVKSLNFWKIFCSICLIRWELWKNSNVKFSLWTQFDVRVNWCDPIGAQGSRTPSDHFILIWCSFRGNKWANRFGVGPPSPPLRMGNPGSAAAGAENIAVVASKIWNSRTRDYVFRIQWTWKFVGGLKTAEQTNKQTNWNHLHRDLNRNKTRPSGRNKRNEMQSAVPSLLIDTRYYDQCNHFLSPQINSHRSPTNLSHVSLAISFSLVRASHSYLIGLNVFFC